MVCCKPLAQGFLFVSAGMLSPKKGDHMLTRQQRYLNYGALSLATTLDTMGISTLLVHGEPRRCPYA